ncbi:glycosyltransferase family 2 protein [Synechococcus sp. CS-1332]|uniref:glycosyltransferase family 2 protein n=1 Tax=Synechococcus sp. CS-1332 TaxID=2847972 RepID=UPI00223BAFE2|nr:glycosyltransferase family 2 protein [Synechococcus sp. CS-1332]MCT0206793.1 glycosyltransferase [Synechococcus sp. CS-1332]
MKRSDQAPLVSVIVPNYNHGAFLAERLQSILSQSFQDFELIVLDDASGDDSPTVIRQQLSQHPHRLVCNALNSGQPCSQWLSGMEMATGRYIWIAESDDTCSPVFLERMVSRLEGGSVLSYCRTTSIDATGDPITPQSFWPDQVDPDRWQHSFTIAAVDFCRTYMARGNVIANASGVVFRQPDRALLRALRLRTAGRRCTGDWLFWTDYLMRMGGTVSFDNEAHSGFRCHDRSTRSTVSRSQEKLRFAEYSSTITSVLQMTRPRPGGHWHDVATSGGWDWILYEYLWRYQPSLAEKLLIRILRGPLRLGLYLRLLQSPLLRRRYLRWPTT